MRGCNEIQNSTQWGNTWLTTKLIIIRRRKQHSFSALTLELFLRRCLHRLQQNLLGSQHLDWKCFPLCFCTFSRNHRILHPVGAPLQMSPGGPKVDWFTHSGSSSVSCKGGSARALRDYWLSPTLICSLQVAALKPWAPQALPVRSCMYKRPCYILTFSTSSV